MPRPEWLESASEADDCLRCRFTKSFEGRLWGATTLPGSRLTRRAGSEENARMARKIAETVLEFGLKELTDRLRASGADRCTMTAGSSSAALISVLGCGDFAGVPNLGMGSDTNGLVVWVSNYCASHPLDHVATAVGELVLELRARNLSRLTHLPRARSFLTGISEAMYNQTAEANRVRPPAVPQFEISGYLWKANVLPIGLETGKETMWCV